MSKFSKKLNSISNWIVIIGFPIFFYFTHQIYKEKDQLKNDRIEVLKERIKGLKEGQVNWITDKYLSLKAMSQQEISENRKYIDSLENQILRNNDNTISITLNQAKQAIIIAERNEILEELLAHYQEK